jgi:hypothetical protein
MMYLHIQSEPYTFIQTNVRGRKLKIFSRGITLSKNHQAMPNSKLTCIILNKFNVDLCNPMMYPCIKFELNVCNPYRDNERRLKISIFSKFKRDNSVKNQQTITKFELDLRIPMSNLTCNLSLIYTSKRKLKSGN